MWPGVPQEKPLTLEERRAAKYYAKRLKKVKARWRNVKKG